MSEPQLPLPGDVAIMATIGQVCLQWARLEMTLLGLICVVEPMEIEKGYIIYGGLDILPRVNMAINLARHNKVPPVYTKRIVAVRTSLQGGLLERRNQVVHGAHRDMNGAETTLTMVRWQGDKRHKTISAVEIGALGNEIFELGSEVWAIMEDLIDWDARGHLQEDLNNAVS